MAVFRRKLLPRIDLHELARLDPPSGGPASSGSWRPARQPRRAAAHVQPRALGLIRRVVDEALGLGVLEPLLADEAVTEIMVNGPDDLRRARSGACERVDARFASAEQLYQTIDRIVSTVNRRVDESSPMVDARLPTGERVNVILPPLALDGPIAHHPPLPPAVHRCEQLVAAGTLDVPTARMLLGSVRAGPAQHHRLRRHRLGQDDAAQRLSAFIPDRRAHRHHRGRRRAVPAAGARRSGWSPGRANVEGNGQVAIRDLVRNSLRMRPDRIIVGEVRGGETLDMLQAMNTGHEGSLATVHANSADDALVPARDAGAA